MSTPESQNKCFVEVSELTCRPQLSPGWLRQERNVGTTDSAVRGDWSKRAWQQELAQRRGATGDGSWRAAGKGELGCWRGRGPAVGSSYEHDGRDFQQGGFSRACGPPVAAGMGCQAGEWLNAADRGVWAC